MSCRLFCEKLIERFGGQGKIRRLDGASLFRFGLVQLGIDGNSIARIEEGPVWAVDPGRVCLVSLKAFVTHILVQPSEIPAPDRLDHGIPGRVVISEGFQRLAVLGQKSIEGAFGFDEPVHSDLTKLLLVEGAKGPEAGHENRHHRQEQKRDLGLDFHFYLTTSRCLPSGPGAFAQARFRRLLHLFIRVCVPPEWQLFSIRHRSPGWSTSSSSARRPCFWSFGPRSADQKRW